MDITDFSANDSLQISYNSENDVQFVFYAQNHDQSGVAVNKANDELYVAGRAFSFGPGMVWVEKVGVCAIIIESKLYARIALHTSSFSADDCFALPLPLYARGDGDNLPITIQGSPAWAGWQSALPAGGVVRMTGFNLPRTLTSHSGSVQTTINAEGGDYGIEFTIPQDCDKVDIFDETFWLYIAPYI